VHTLSTWMPLYGFQQLWDQYIAGFDVSKVAAIFLPVSVAFAPVTESLNLS